MDGVPTTTTARDDAMMIQDFEDFSLWDHYIVDEICQQLARPFQTGGDSL